MMLARRNFAAAPALELRRELDRLVDGFFGRETPGLFAGVRPYPALNLWQDGECLYAEAEVPGLAMDDLEILIRGNELTIKGQRKPAEGEKLVYHRRERGTGAFTRYLTLPDEVNANRVEATLKNGVLTIMMPKAESARTRKIAVKTG